MNILGEDNWTSLYLATYLGYNKVISQLLKRDDIDLNIENIGYFPLQIAILKKNVEAVQILVDDHRTNLNAQGKDGDTALHYAISLKQLDIVKILLESDRIDVNAVNNEKNTPLHQAALFNFEEAVDLLVQHKDIDFRIKNKEVFFYYFKFMGKHLMNVLWIIQQQRLLILLKMKCQKIYGKKKKIRKYSENTTKLPYNNVNILIKMIFNYYLIYILLILLKITVCLLALISL